MLQKIVPNIIHTSKEENAICIPKISNLIMDNATVRKTNVTDIESLLDLEWKNFSKNVNNKPITKPRSNERTTSKIGSTTTESIST